MNLMLQIVDGAGAVQARAEADDEVFLVYRSTYRPGDRLVVAASEPGHVFLSFDAAVQPAILYLREPHFSLPVLFGDRRVPYAPQAFSGDLHRLHVRKATAEEVAQRRNLAFNPLDDHSNSSLFPHAFANVETRGEAVFAARNAIDGEKANNDHGSWPYTSWGINRDPEAALTVDFGRSVRIDELVLYLRADFPHDAWWEKASLTFSDGETMRVDLRKSAAGQRFAIPPRIVQWVRLHSLIKAEDPSPYPALTQIEVWGTEA
jgi:hypothetical protein